MQLKGRHWVLLWLGLFLLVASLVVARTSAAFRLSRELSALREERMSLEGRRAELERRLRAASSRAVLLDRAARSGLRVPEDSEIVVFGWPPAAAGDRR